MNRTSINSILLLFRSEFDQCERSKIILRTVDALASFGFSRIARYNFNTDSLLLTTCRRSQISIEAGICLLLHGLHAHNSHGRALSPAYLLQKFKQAGADCFEEVEPPFLAFAGDAQSVIATSDSIGLSHLFYWQDRTCAAVATSAALLGRIFAASLDINGVYQSMTLGHRLGESSAFAGVSMLPAGSRAVLAEGRLTILGPDKTNNAVMAAPSGITSGVSVARSIVSSCLAAVPDCGIELSGGLDSRMVLAAVPRDIRKNRTAYTIGYSGSPDVSIASDIAKKFELRHVLVDLSKFADESTETTWQRARRVAYRDDFATNIFDRLAIDCVDDELLESPRIGGVNGEFARGFYYPMLPVESSISAESISRFVTWRLIINDATPRELFSPPILRMCREALQGWVTGELQKGPEPLGNALDRFYLNQRMRHWAGSAICRAISSRAVLTPFFHRAYVEWATRLSVKEKKDSLAFSCVLTALDADLGSMPLDSMLTPRSLAQIGIKSKFSLLRAKARKLKLKIQQRFHWRHRLVLGSEQFSAKLCQQEVIDQIDWHSLHSVGLFDDKGLEFLRVGKLPWDRRSLGQILALHFQMEFLRGGSGRPAADVDMLN